MCDTCDSFIYMTGCVYVYVCVCERETEGERTRARAVEGGVAVGGRGGSVRECVWATV